MGRTCAVLPRLVLGGPTISRALTWQAFSKSRKAIHNFPLVREGNPKLGLANPIAFHRQRGCEQRSGHSEIDGGEGFEAIYSVLGKERTVTEFWREHASDLQRQIHPSTSMAVPASIGEHQLLRAVFGAGAEPGGQVHICRWITAQWHQLRPADFALQRPRVAPMAQ